MQGCYLEWKGNRIGVRYFRIVRFDDYAPITIEKGSRVTFTMEGSICAI